MPDDLRQGLLYHRGRISSRAECLPPVRVACTDNQFHALSHAFSSLHM